MSLHDVRVSIGLPVRNGESSIEHAIRSVLSQDDERVELVISDNASDDGTEDICRTLARSDRRVRYHRLPANIGQLNNFNRVMTLTTGPYVRWLSADDWLGPAYVSRCLERFADEPGLLLVTTGQVFVDEKGHARTDTYTGHRLRSPRPVERFDEMLRLLTQSDLLLDPVYSLIRRDTVAQLPRRNMLFEDEIYAAKLALAGPFGHIPDVLAYRGFKPFPNIRRMAERLDVPRWQARVASLLQCQELVRSVWAAPLTRKERRQALRSVGQLYVRGHTCTAVRRARKLVSLATGR